MNRILGCIPIEKALEIVKEYRVYLATTVSLASEDMELEEDATDIEERAEAATLLVFKRIKAKQRKSDTAGVIDVDEEDTSSKKKG